MAKLNLEKTSTPKQGTSLSLRDYAPFLAALASVCMCAAGLVYHIGPPKIWVVVEILFVGALALKSIPAAIAVLIVISPYNSALRVIAGDDFLIRGARDLMSYAIFAVYCLNHIGKMRTKPHAAGVLLFVCWCCIVQLVNSSSLLVGILGLRQLVQFFLLFPIIVALLTEDARSSAESLLGIIVFSAGILSVVQLANQFGYINIPVQGGSETLMRAVGNEQVARMIPIWEVSPSGLAVYMISASMIVIARLGETGKVPILWLACLVGCLACAGLSLSHSGVVSILLGLAVVSICGRRKALGALVLGVVFVAVLPILFGKASFTEQDTADYSVTFFQIWDASLTLALQHPVFGTGAAPSGYLAELVEGEARSIGDGGWALFACQIGIPVALGMLWWAVSILKGAVLTLLNDKPADGSKRWVLLAALGAAVVYFVNAHGVPWYRVGADVNFIVLAGILTALGVRETPSFISDRRRRRQGRRNMAESTESVPAAKTT